VVACSEGEIPFSKGIVQAIPKRDSFAVCVSLAGAVTCKIVTEVRKGNVQYVLIHLESVMA
jgi:hypothetical protein